ncbi:13161_t:CDS:10 [Acaulospora morrowiae]|uniref:13161_t:CDS:1 n=1 Tax=Acaulospora morrowiae TaxID=94023 RepID=A0A9N9D0U8_9GLOM|nr:13161_t:CDS:10 [Acaulospora morrowiae]
MSEYNFQTLKITLPTEFVIHVELNRPQKLNAFNQTLWKELGECFARIGADPAIRAVVISGAGKLFTAGIDFAYLEGVVKVNEDDIARKLVHVRRWLKLCQDSISIIETCDKPVIAAIHNGCIGAGINLVTACDIRYCSQDAYFSVKEVDIGLAADVGVLQRLPKIVGNDSLVRELCLTGRNCFATEAFNFGLVNKVLQTKEEALAEAIKTAEIIASKSPVATLGTKHLLNYSRDHSVREGLEYTLAWNGAMLNSEDVIKAYSAAKKKVKPTFSKL